MAAAVCARQGVRTPILQLSAMQEGDYTFQLTVTDSSGQQDTAQVTVIVQPGKCFYCFSGLALIIYVLTRGFTASSHRCLHLLALLTCAQYQRLWFLTLLLRLLSPSVCRKQQASGSRCWAGERVDAACGPNHAGRQ